MSVDSYVTSLKRQGFCVINGVIPPEDCRRFRDIYFDVYMARRVEVSVSPGVGLLQGGINYAPSIADYLVDDRIIQVCEALLRSPVRTSFTTAIINDAGAEDGPLHADWPFDATHVAHIRPPYPDLCLHITSLWSLSPPDQRFGGTQVIPRSHQTSTNPTAPDWRDDMGQAFGAGESILGEEGSVLLLDSRVWHARVANRADAPRILFAAGYVPWWLNIEPLRPGTPVAPGLTTGPGKKDYRVPLIRKDTYAALSQRARSFFSHWVESA